MKELVIQGKLANQGKLKGIIDFKNVPEIAKQPRFAGMKKLQVS